MKKSISIFMAIVLPLTILLAGCEKRNEIQPEQTAAWPVNVQGEAKNKIRLEDDYYESVNQSLLKATKIPEDSNSWSYFYKLDKDAYQVLHEVLSEAVQNRQQAMPGSLEQKIADMYLTAMDKKGREEAGFGALQPYMDKIRNASSIEEYLESVGKLYSDLGLGSIFTIEWYEDMGDSTRYAFYMDGADLGPGKETLEDKTQDKLIQQYKEYIQKIMEYAGLNQNEADRAASDILGFQKDLAASALSLSEQSKPDVIYNIYSAKELNNLFSNVEVEPFLKAAGLSGIDFCIVTQVHEMKKINQYLTREHLPLLKNYTLFCLINDLAPYLTYEIRDTYVDWYNVQKGIREKKTDEKMASELIQDLLGFEFGKLYVEKCFSEEDKLAIQDMVHQILTAYKKQIAGVSFMGEETKGAAIKKLDSMTLKIGYPDKWPDDYAKSSILPVENGGTFIDNTLSLIKAKNQVDKEKVRRPVDKSEWGMTPQTVNAYYNPTGNEIVFPAAILQAPFYDPDAESASNLGGIGMVIAHEVSHAFDASGSLYDENGNYHVWWTKKDRTSFQKLADKVVAYYDSQEGFEGRHVNGAQTLNENIADLGALSCITSIAGDDADKLKLLFKQYATIWACKYTPASMIQRLNTDVHSPAKVRVNAVLSSTDSFYKAYPNIKEGDGMYTAPDQRVKIW